MPIVAAWHRLNLPGEPGTSCRSPFREDRNPSFSVFDKGRAWKDHATAEGGDVVCFIERATGCTRGQAITRLLAMAGIEDTPRRKRRTKARTWPEFRPGTRAEKRALAVLRNLGPEAIDIAAARGFLHFADMPDDGETVVAWIVSDNGRRNGQARRLDGKPWQSGEAKGAKAKTLPKKPNGGGAWPIGAECIEGRPIVALLEGGADLLAAFHFMYNEGRLEDVAPVAMLGAGMKIPAAALPYFKGKRVRIFPDIDEKGQGQAAGRRWAKQLRGVGGKVDGFSFEGLIQTRGAPVGDLNELTNQDPDNWESTWDAREVFP